MNQLEHIEFKIVTIDFHKPKIGEPTSKSVVYVVPVTDKTCDMYVSDPNGNVRLVSSHVPTFETVAEAHTAVAPENRYIGKIVLIGSIGSYEEYWWIDGLTNSHLVKKGSSQVVYKKTFLKTFAAPHTSDITIDTTQFNIGDEWIITFQGAALPNIVLDGTKKAKLIDIGVDFQANVKSRIYLHLIEISGTDYYFDTTITPITLMT